MLDWQVADLELMQAPGLAYSIPKEFRGLPRLTGESPGMLPGAP